MAVIELSDEQAAALKEKAAAQGLTLEAWLEKLSGQPDRFADSEASQSGRQAAAAAILDLQKNVKPDPDGWTIRDYVNYGRR